MTHTQEPKLAYLDEDPIKVPEARYVLLSFVSPVSNIKCDKIRLKVRGVFKDMDSAKHHVRRLMETDPTFDIFVADCNRWLLVSPKATNLKNVEYSNHVLQELVQTHKDEQVKAKAAFENYKKEMMETGSPLKELKEELKLDVSRDEQVDEFLEE